MKKKAFTMIELVLTLAVTALISVSALKVVSQNQTTNDKCTE